MNPFWKLVFDVAGIIANYVLVTIICIMAYQTYKAGQIGLAAIAFALLLRLDK